MFGGSGLPAQDMLPLGKLRNRSGTSQMGRVLPLLHGTNRMGCTFISSFFDVMASSVTSGGKGGQIEGYNYYASFAVAVGHGPMLSLQQIYLNDTPVYTTGALVEPSQISVTTNVAMVSTTNPHGLQSGDVIFMFYCFQEYLNGQFTVTVTSPTQFQYTIPGTSVPNGFATAQNGYSILFEISLPTLFANGADSTEITLPNFGTATIHWGTLTQPADEYLISQSGIQHPPYKGICYIVFNQLFLGFNQTNAQNVEVVMTRTPAFAWQSNQAHALINETYGDCNPGNIIADLLLNPRAGLGLVPGVDVNTAMLDAAIEQFFGYGMGLSPITTRPDEMRSLFMSILQNADAAPALDVNGLLGIVFATPPAFNDGEYDCPKICDDDLTDLQKFDPGDWSSVVNQTFMTFVDQEAGWEQDYVSWHDNAGVYAKERPEPQTLDRPMVTHRDLATVLCAVFGQINALPKGDGKFQIAWSDAFYGELTPGSAFYYESGLRPQYNGVYRLTGVALPDPAKPVMELEFQIDRSYLYTNAQTQLVLLADQ